MAQGKGFVSLEEALNSKNDQVDRLGIYPYQNKSGEKRFRAQYYDSSLKKTVSRSFRKFSSALSFRKSCRIQKELNYPVLVKGMKLTDFLDYWMKTEVKVKRELSTYKIYKNIVKNHLVTCFKGLKINEVKLFHLNDLLITLKNKTLKEKTIDLIFSVLSRCFEYAIVHEVISLNPMNKFSRLKHQEIEADYWEIEDLQKFVRHVRQKPFYYLIVTSIRTGMRKGEICGLKWGAVDFKNELIKCSHTRNSKESKDRTKTARIRFVPMSKDLKKILLELKSKAFSAGPNDYIFITRRLRPISYNSVLPMFKKYQVQAKVSKLISFHGLRHSFISHFLMEGGSLEDAQILSGHSSTKTLERYRHLSKDYIKKSSKIIEKLKL